MNNNRQEGHSGHQPRSPSFGKSFARVGPRMDARGAAEHRRRLLEAAHGIVVEIGAGYGATFAFYPPAVTGVLALEPDPTLRELALAAARKAPVPVTVRDGMAESLPAADASVDVVVSSLVLCSVLDQSAALAEVVRVLRPGGLLLFYEHVRSAHRVLAAAEDLVTPLWSRIAGGCHPNRNTDAVIAEAGFKMQGLERFGFSALPGNPRLAHVLGVACKP
ncbi:SAM-dependent methyltransferase [Arthrobacter ginsengisoli]|uniref:SAM-dependent methyltransferase n=1 Tax=Arthrobacter ginsengisoli TaxID=1356565 RepID=A0ABU1U935_9MICC|nr:methyltransferase domain-containing protein [Arthrobacter ginsengisoli]MDR7081714.1 SAM-dependent methyltransferase [Arthrobacter ginsengisoli]